jgi:SAM-dependent methyltransferase
MENRALSFGQAARAYDRIRPGYPVEAVRWALGEPGRTVDLGAGTGLLTRVLLRMGFDTVPVEPDDGMRAQLAVATPGVTPLAGSAEAIPLPDGSVDAVIAGQAYHWFDRERAHIEIGRVVRPGGVFAAIWNTRDESVDWVAALTRAAHLHEPAGQPGDGSHDADARVETFGPLFGPVERAEFRHGTEHTVESLVELMRSRSYYLTAAPELRAEIDAAVRDVATSIGQERFELPYITEAYRAFRTSPTFG